VLGLGAVIERDGIILCRGGIEKEGGDYPYFQIHIKESGEECTIRGPENSK